ncbi:hypothetical protein [Cytobacillus kochii]|uniref:hypothetical protein n=1 Tax=Cytobacillus kochii TaxID=859143 RepID=UPI00402AE4B2
MPIRRLKAAFDRRVQSLFIESGLFSALGKGVEHKKWMFQIQSMKKQPLCWHNQRLITDRLFRVEFVYSK